MKHLLQGTGVALVTPFDQNQEVDYNGLANVIEHVVNGKVEYVVLLGTTGESVTLSNSEKNRILDFSIERINGRVPIVAGFGGNSTHSVIQSIQSRSFDGIDAILSVSPYYNKPTQEGIFEHYSMIANESPLPIILYNVPSRTSSNINASTTLRLAQHPNIMATKEASGDFTQVMDILKDKPDDFQVISGDDLTTLPLVALGVSGVISVIANAYPFEFSELTRHALNGDFKQAGNIHFSLMSLMKLIFEEGNPAGVKSVLNSMGVCEPHVRLPLVNASDSLTEKIQEQISLAL